MDQYYSLTIYILDSSNNNWNKSKQTYYQSQLEVNYGLVNHLISFIGKLAISKSETWGKILRDTVRHCSWENNVAKQLYQHKEELGIYYTINTHVFKRAEFPKLLTPGSDMVDLTT